MWRCIRKVPPVPHLLSRGNFASNLQSFVSFSARYIIFGTASEWIRRIFALIQCVYFFFWRLEILIFIETEFAITVLATELLVLDKECRKLSHFLLWPVIAIVIKYNVLIFAEKCSPWVTRIWYRAICDCQQCPNLCCNPPPLTSFQISWINSLHYGIGSCALVVLLESDCRSMIVVRLQLVSSCHIQFQSFVQRVWWLDRVVCPISICLIEDRFMGDTDKGRLVTFSTPQTNV